VVSSRATGTVPQKTPYLNYAVWYVTGKIPTELGCLEGLATLKDDTQKIVAMDPTSRNNLPSRRRVGRNGPPTDPFIQRPEGVEVDERRHEDTEDNNIPDDVNGGGAAVPVNPVAPGTPPPVRLEFPCTECSKSYRTSRGLGQHMRHAHPVAHNANVDVVRIKARWSDEEARLLIQEEARLTLAGPNRNINQLLHAKFPARTLEGIKGRRRNADHKMQVVLEVDALRSPRTEEATTRPSGGNESIGTREELALAVCEDLESLSGENRWGAHTLKQAVQAFLEGDTDENHLLAWLQTVIPPRTHRSTPIPGVSKTNPPNGRERRRRCYARTQKLWKKNRGAAVKEILSSPEESACVPPVEAMFKTWSEILETPGSRVRNSVERASTELADLWRPVAKEEVVASELKVKTSPGLDNITVKAWRGIPPNFRRIFYNLVMLRGKAPEFLTKGRTIFICKKAGGSTIPTDYRPITVASVVIRQFHKILAKRIQKEHKWDERQRAFLPMDGCAENLTVLNALLHTARTRLKELHLGSIDISKAFDSIPYDATINITCEHGAPNQFVEYLAAMYSDNYTTLQFLGQEKVCKVGRGVRQGDPLSPLLFNLVLEKALVNLNTQIGFTIGSARVNALAYADDVILVAGTKLGLEENLARFGGNLESSGLKFNLLKCGVVSMVPSGRQKRIKVLDGPTIKYGDQFLPQVDLKSMWKYLGVQFEGPALQTGTTTLVEELAKLTRAPLKPQQRLIVLREFLIPSHQHAWVLGRFNKRYFRKLDVQVREKVRGWLRLPHDVPIGFFHASVKDGGLGIPSLQYTIPMLKLSRLMGLRRSTSTIVAEVLADFPTQELITILTRALVGVTPELTKNGLAAYWATKLHESVDGKELRDVVHTSASSNWLSSTSHVLSGADFIHAVHTRINCLPSKVRTTRGRRTVADIRCRGGCESTETTYHTIQQCHRTHGVRILRHDKLVEVLTDSFASLGWRFWKEPHLRTSVGLRKPDLIVHKGNAINVIDAQVVAGSSLEAAHAAKINKYRTCQGFSDCVLSLVGVSSANAVIDHTPLTISWRGVWSKSSAAGLIPLVPRRTLEKITRYTVHGSFLNFRTFNKTTTRHHQHQ